MKAGLETRTLCPKGDLEGLRPHWDRRGYEMSLLVGLLNRLILASGTRTKPAQLMKPLLDVV